MLQGPCNREMRLLFKGPLLDKRSCIVPYTVGGKMMKQGCQVFIANLVSFIEQLTQLSFILVVSELFLVFLEILWDFTT